MTVDVAIIGSSPNALAAAARLARGGKRVVVVEPGELGGPVVTEEFAPGFRGNVAVPAVELDSEIATTLDVSLDVVRPAAATNLGGNGDTLFRMPTRVPTQPPTLDTMVALQLPVVDAAIALVYAIDRIAPPQPSSPGELVAIGQQLLGLSERTMHDVLRLLFVSVRDFCAEHGLREPHSAMLAGIATRGRASGPFAPGTMFGLLRHAALGDALFRPTVRGGVSRVPLALAKAAESAGATIRSRVGNVTIDIDGGVATGVILAGGEKIAATSILSDLDARATFTRLVSPAELDPETKRNLRTLRYRGTVARIQLAVRELPRITDPGPAPLGGPLVLLDSVASLERNWDEAKRGALPRSPYIELSIPTLHDPSLAPDGRHVIDLWVQHVPYAIADHTAVLARVLDTLAPVAPGFADLVLHSHVALPRDLEARFGLTEGHLYGGELSLEQSFLFRPFSGCTGYETPIRHLYLCGSAAHPGGYTGRSGWNLAGKLLS